MTAFEAHISTVRHQDQRYPTVGDWRYATVTDAAEPPRERLIVRVSELPDWRYMALVAIHETIEAVLCQHRGITDEQVTAFDREFEAERQNRMGQINEALGWGAAMKRGQIAGIEAEEPGDDPRAPYFAEHQFATLVEEMLAIELGVLWSEYSAAIEALA